MAGGWRDAARPVLTAAVRCGATAVWLLHDQTPAQAERRMPAVVAEKCPEELYAAAQPHLSWLQQQPCKQLAECLIGDSGGLSAMLERLLDLQSGSARDAAVGFWSLLEAHAVAAAAAAAAAAASAAEAATRAAAAAASAPAAAGRRRPPRVALAAALASAADEPTAAAKDAVAQPLSTWARHGGAAAGTSRQQLPDSQAFTSMQFPAAAAGAAQAGAADAAPGKCSSCRIGRSHKKCPFCINCCTGSCQVQTHKDRHRQQAAAAAEAQQRQVAAAALAGAAVAHAQQQAAAMATMAMPWPVAQQQAGAAAAAAFAGTLGLHMPAYAANGPPHAIMPAAGQQAAGPMGQHGLAELGMAPAAGFLDPHTLLLPAFPLPAAAPAPPLVQPALPPLPPPQPLPGLGGGSTDWWQLPEVPLSGHSMLSPRSTGLRGMSAHGGGSPPLSARSPARFDRSGGGITSARDSVLWSPSRSPLPKRRSLPSGK